MGKTFDIKPLQIRTVAANKRCARIEASIRYTKGADKTEKILSIFCHHLNGSIMSLEMCVELFERGKRDKDTVEERISTMEFELGNAEKFMDDIENGMFPDEITFIEYGTKFTYKAVECDGTVKIKRKITQDGINEEKKRIRSIISKGGAYYYEEMLEELNSGEFGKRYVLS